MTDEIPGCSHSVDYSLENTISAKRIRPSRRKQRSASVLPDKCQICNEAAVGYHYDVPSCNGCKAFFRRTIITGRRHKCLNRRRCLDEVLERRLCGSCRFAKCVELGMNPMAIQEELVSEEGKVLQQEIMEGRKVGIKKVRKPSIMYENELDAVLEELLQAERQLEEFHANYLCSRGSRTHFDWRSLAFILSSRQSLAINDHECVPDRSFSASTSLSDCFEHYSLLCMVEHAKLLNFISCLDLESTRKIVARGALICRSMTMTHYSMKHSKQEDNTAIRTEQLKFIEKTMVSFNRNCLDCKEYMLLKAIILCDPGVPDLPLNDHITIENERHRYAQSLLAYCLKQHGTMDGPSRYAALLSLVSIFEHHQWEQKCYHVLMNSFYRESVSVSPLYDEIMGCSL